jgi:hypothetical protein
MKLLSRLLLNQIGHPPSRPQGRAVAQRLRSLFQFLAQLLQLHRLEPRPATHPGSFSQRFCPLSLPGLMPTTDRLAVDGQFPGNLPLAKSLVKESGRLESSPLQFIEIALNAFGISHAQKTTESNRSCHYITRISIKRSTLDPFNNDLSADNEEDLAPDY